MRLDASADPGQVGSISAPSGLRRQVLQPEQHGREGLGHARMVASRSRDTTAYCMMIHGPNGTRADNHYLKRARLCDEARAPSTEGFSYVTCTVCGVLSPATLFGQPGGGLARLGGGA